MFKIFQRAHIKNNKVSNYGILDNIISNFISN